MLIQEMVKANQYCTYIETNRESNTEISKTKTLEIHHSFPTLKFQVACLTIVPHPIILRKFSGSLVPRDDQ